MMRPGFSTAQTRSFAYSGNILTSATNPENGTVSYTYNTTYNKVSQRTDAKGQVTAYTYDAYARLTGVQRYPSGLGGSADPCQQEVYYYDGNNPLSSSYPQYAVGHLSAVQYMGGYNPGTAACDTTFTEMYTYATSGAPVGKELLATRTLQYSGEGWFPYTVTLAAAFSYDNEGRMTAETYPTDNSGNTANLSYAFDKMGRLNTMTDNVAMETVIAGASYGPANELTGITAGGAWGSEIRTYNSLKQLTGLSAGTLFIAYAYPTTGNNGKISTQTDVSGETVTYTYDTLNRLITAANQTTFSPEWGQSFGYDGFGNLTNVSVTQGSAPTLSASYDYKNHAGGEDANGNPSYVPLPAYGTSVPAGYDIENRLVSGPAYYSYAPGNKRVWRGSWTTTYSDGSYIYTRGTDEITFWSVTGQKLAEYAVTATQGCCSGTDSYMAPQYYVTQTATNYYFGSKLIKNGNGNYFVYSDRLGSIGKFYRYGQERPTATTNGKEKFTGYFRDAETGNDYADQKYASPGTGRFITPDSGTGGARPSKPGTWNKYSYTGGDPINNIDPRGAEYCSVDFCVTGYGAGDGAGDGSIGSGGPVGVGNGTGGANPQCGLLAEAGAAGNPEASEQYETYCLGGGLQTQGAANGDITVPNFSNSGPLQDIITLDLQKLEGWLTQNATCSSWLTGNLAGTDENLVGLIAGYISGNLYGYGTAYVNGTQSYTNSAFTGWNNADQTPTGVPVGTVFTINTAGAFFTMNGPGGTLTVGAGNWTGGTLQAQAAILIHELAHLTGAAGFVSDTGGTPAQNAANVAANDALVGKYCGFLINEFQ
jgi:RHS repeat-associated protein